MVAAVRLARSALSGRDVDAPGALRDALAARRYALSAWHRLGMPVAAAPWSHYVALYAPLVTPIGAVFLRAVLQHRVAA